MENINRKTIVVTGASGFVGRQLVERFARDGHRLIVVGRSPQRLADLFPDAAPCGYDEISDVARGADLLIHLAVANTDSDLDADAIHEVNASLTRQVGERARDANIGRMVYISSTHALDPANISPYASSKRAGAKALDEIDGLETTTIHLPLVHGDRFAGKLAALNSLPRALRMMAFSPLAALKPTVHVDSVADAILSDEVARQDDTVIISASQFGNWTYGTIKRLTDLLFVLFVGVLLWWALAIVWVAVRLSSPGPGIFAQTRVGKDGRPFTCYKFRTMAVGTKQVGTHELSAASVTRIGAILRRLKIDELPQIVNIFRNELSLIGPRPCLPSQEELVEERRARGVLAVKPGISGLAQVNDIDMSDPTRLARWDARYIRQRSLILDTKIILATAIGKGQGDKVAADTSTGL